MSKAEIYINDSYKRRPLLEQPYESHHKKIGLSLSGHLSFKTIISYDINENGLRLTNIDAYDIEKGFGAGVSIQMSTNNSIHEGKHAIRITIGMTHKNLFDSEVGNSILKLTFKGDIIQYSKTENVADFEIIPNK